MADKTGQKIFGLAGWSGSGKTVLMTRLLPEIIGRGFSVSTLKHAHHAFDIDQPGKDSHRHRTAGATEVLVASANRWALMHELRGAAEPSLQELLGHMSKVDLLLVEGFKHDHFPKLEVHRTATGKALLAPDDPDIVAIAGDPTNAPPHLPRFDLDDAVAIADFILGCCGLLRTASNGDPLLLLK